MLATIPRSPALRRSGIVETSTPTLHYRGADDDDRAELLEAVQLFKVRVAERREDFGRCTPWLSSDEFSRLPEFRYWAPSWSRWAPVVTVDIDSAYDHDRIDSLPTRPNWIGINNSNGHSQYIWYLDTPVYGRGYTRSYFDWVSRRLTQMLDGDRHFSRSMSRNPLDESGEYQWHAQHHAGVSLGELDAQIPFDDEADFRPKYRRRSSSRAATPTFDEDGLMHRKIYLFDVARSEGYRIRGTGHRVRVSDLLPLLHSTSQEIAKTDSRPQLPQSIFTSIARSVTRFCNNSMSPGAGSGKLSFYTREQLIRGGRTQGAIQGPANSMNGTLERARTVKSAISTLRHAEIRMLYESGVTNKAEIARRLGVSRPTVYAALSGEKV